MYGHVHIHDRTAAELTAIEMDYAWRLRPISKPEVISPQPDGQYTGVRTHALVRMASFSSVSFGIFPMHFFPHLLQAFRPARALPSQLRNLQIKATGFPYSRWGSLRPCSRRGPSSFSISASSSANNSSLSGHQGLRPSDGMRTKTRGAEKIGDLRVL